MEASNYPDSQNRCPECHRASGDPAKAANPEGLVCPACGKPLPGIARKKLWALFWVLFIGTPIAALLMARTPTGRSSALLLSLAGILAAGYTLAKLFSRTTVQFVFLGIAFSMLLLCVYASVALAVAFAGCVWLITKHK